MRESSNSCIFSNIANQPNGAPIRHDPYHRWPIAFNNHQPFQVGLNHGVGTHQQNGHFLESYATCQESSMVPPAFNQSYVNVSQQFLSQQNVMPIGAERSSSDYNNNNLNKSNNTNGKCKKRSKNSNKNSEVKHSNGNRFLSTGLNTSQQEIHQHQTWTHSLGTSQPLYSYNPPSQFFNSTPRFLGLLSIAQRAPRLPQQQQHHHHHHHHHHHQQQQQQLQQQQPRQRLQQHNPFHNFSPPLANHPQQHLKFQQRRHRELPKQIVPSTSTSSFIDPFTAHILHGQQTDKRSQCRKDMLLLTARPEQRTFYNHNGKKRIVHWCPDNQTNHARISSNRGQGSMHCLSSSHGMRPSQMTSGSHHGLIQNTACPTGISANMVPPCQPNYTHMTSNMENVPIVKSLSSTYLNRYCNSSFQTGFEGRGDLRNPYQRSERFDIQLSSEIALAGNLKDPIPDFHQKDNAHLSAPAVSNPNPVQSASFPPPSINPCPPHSAPSSSTQTNVNSNHSTLEPCITHYPSNLSNSVSPQSFNTFEDVDTTPTVVFDIINAVKHDQPKVKLEDDAVLFNPQQPLPLTSLGLESASGDIVPVQLIPNVHTPQHRRTCTGTHTSHSNLVISDEPDTSLGSRSGDTNFFPCSRNAPNINELRQGESVLVRKEEFYKCGLCIVLNEDCNFESVDGLLSHLDDTHSGYATLPCPHCKDVVDRFNILKHMKVKHQPMMEKINFICGGVLHGGWKCAASFDTLYALWQHMRSKHSTEGEFECSNCQKQFQTIKSYICHHQEVATVVRTTSKTVADGGCGSDKDALMKSSAASCSQVHVGRVNCERSSRDQECDVGMNEHDLNDDRRINGRRKESHLLENGVERCQINLEENEKSNEYNLNDDMLRSDNHSKDVTVENMDESVENTSLTNDSNKDNLEDLNVRKSDGNTEDVGMGKSENSREVESIIIRKSNIRKTVISVRKGKNCPEDDTAHRSANTNSKSHPTVMNARKRKTRMEGVKHSKFKMEVSGDLEGNGFGRNEICMNVDAAGGYTKTTRMDKSPGKSYASSEVYNAIMTQFESPIRSTSTSTLQSCVHERTKRKRVLIKIVHQTDAFTESIASTPPLTPMDNLNEVLHLKRKRKFKRGYSFDTPDDVREGSRPSTSNPSTKKRLAAPHTFRRKRRPDRRDRLLRTVGDSGNCELATPPTQENEREEGSGCSRAQVPSRGKQKRVLWPSTNTSSTANDSDGKRPKSITFRSGDLLGSKDLLDGEDGSGDVSVSWSDEAGGQEHPLLAKPPPLKPTKLELRQLELPKLQPPQLETPQLQPQQLQPPQLETPQLESPELEPLQLETPQLQPPQLQPPQLEPPQLQPPLLETPQLQPPQLEPPQLESPELGPPQLETPQLQPPQLQPPQLEPPQLQPPLLETPQLQPPQLEPPQLESPELEPPELESPELEPPELELPLLSVSGPPQLDQPQRELHQPEPPLWTHKQPSDQPVELSSLTYCCCFCSLTYRSIVHFRLHLTCHAKSVRNLIRTNHTSRFHQCGLCDASLSPGDPDDHAEDASCRYSLCGDASSPTKGVNDPTTATTTPPTPSATNVISASNKAAASDVIMELKESAVPAPEELDGDLPPASIQIDRSVDDIADWTLFTPSHSICKYDDDDKHDPQDSKNNSCRDQKSAHSPISQPQSKEFHPSWRQQSKTTKINSGGQSHCHSMGFRNTCPFKSCLEFYDQTMVLMSPSVEVHSYKFDTNGAISIVFPSF